MPFHNKAKDFVSDVIGEAEDFIRPVTDPIRSGLAKAIPKEAKPYLEVYLNSLLGAAPGVGPLNFATNLFGGTLRQAAIQKLFTDPEDEDTDVDYLTAFGSGLQTAFQGLQPEQRLVDLEKEGVTDRFAGLDNPDTTRTITNRDLLAQTQLPEGATLQLSPAELAALDQPALRYTSATNPEMAARLNLGLTDFNDPSFAQDAARLNAEPSTLNFLQSDVAQAFKDFATPTNPFKKGSVMGGVGEISSQIGATQAVLAPSQVRDAAKALEESERRYQNYLDTLEADQRASVEADTAERIAAHKEYLTLAGFTNAEIDEALIAAGYLASGETAFARGGRVGFDMGGDTGGKTDRMGLGNYIEAEKVRTEFTDKMKRGLQAAQMNMKLNDPGLMRFVNALVPGGEGFYTREEMSFPSMKERYEMNIEKMTRDQARDDFEKKKIENELRKELFDNVVDMIDDRFSDNREQRKMANKGGRMTPEGDPISPDVPKGMQMDLRGGGFIPLGTKPKADDVPAMVGLNEFVLNDEAVSGIGKMLTGKPDPRAGARALYKLQDQMEAIV